MEVAIVALILGLLGAGGAIYAIIRGVEMSKPQKRTSLPPGKYVMRKVEGAIDVYDLELVEEEKDEVKK